jgi:hypothetical protein
MASDAWGDPSQGAPQFGPRIAQNRERQTPVNKCRPRLTRDRVEISVAIMETTDFDEFYRTYKQAVDRWVNAIRAEEALAKGDHSMTQMEAWDDAGFTLHDAELAAKKARDAYKNALRKKNYGF